MSAPQLHVSDGLQLDIDFVTSTNSVLARKGAGKTYTMKVIAEELFTLGQQVVLFDPVGVCWGLRASADGETAGLPILVMGGDHGDVPLSHTSGKALARWLVDTKQSVVLDMSHMSGNEMKRFVADIAEELYRLCRAPMHLMLDEADMFCPQRPQDGEQRMLGAIDKIVRRGRARGLGMTMATQRPAALNKNVLTQCEMLVLLKLLGPQDRAAVKDWLSVYSTGDEAKECMASLGTLKPGEGWFWRPGEYFKRVQVRALRTFDSSATPKVGQELRQPRTLAEVDMAALASLMETAPDEQPAGKGKGKGAAVSSEELDRLRNQAAALPKVQELLVQSEQALADLRKFVAGHLEWLVSQLGVPLPSPEPVGAGDQRHQVAGGIGRHLSDMASKKPLQVRDVVPRPGLAAVYTPEGDMATLSKPQQQILLAVLRFRQLGLDPVDRSHVAVMAGVSPSSSGYRANVTRLKGLGLLDYAVGGGLTATPEGVTAGCQALGASTAPLTLDELREAWFAAVSGPQARMLRALIDAGGAMGKEALAIETGQSATSSGYRANLTKLKSLGLLTYVGADVALTGMLQGQAYRHSSLEVS